MALNGSGAPAYGDEKASFDVENGGRDAKGRKMSRLGTLNAPTGADGEKLDLAGQIEAEAGNAIKYRTCSWQKVGPSALLYLQLLSSRPRWCTLHLTLRSGYLREDFILMLTTLLDCRPSLLGVHLPCNHVVSLLLLDSRPCSRHHRHNRSRVGSLVYIFSPLVSLPAQP